MTVNDLTPAMPAGTFHGLLRGVHVTTVDRNSWPDLVAYAQPFLCGDDSPEAREIGHHLVPGGGPTTRHAVKDCAKGKLRMGYQADQGGRANLAAPQKVQLVKLEREWLGRTVSYRGKTWQVWALAPDKDSLPAVWLVADGVAVHASLSYVHAQGGS